MSEGLDGDRDKHEGEEITGVLCAAVPPPENMPKASFKIMLLCAINNSSPFLCEQLLIMTKADVRSKQKSGNY